MINFRYHIVSIVAVFLALTIGLVMGTTVIREGLVAQLTKDARDFGARAAELRKEKDALETRLGDWDRFGAAVAPALVKGRLAGRPIVLIVEDSVPNATLDRVTEVLRQAGSVKPARLRLTTAWGLDRDTDRTGIADAIASAATAPADLQRDAARSMGERLLVAADPSKPADLLRRLVDAGFLKLQDVPAGAFPAPGALTIVIASGAKDAAPAQDAFFLPLVRVLAGKRIVATAEPTRSADSLASRIVGDGDLGDRIATVDHADTVAGQLSLVRALRSLVEGGKTLHFGTQSGSDGVAPATLS